MPGGSWNIPDFIAALARGALGVKLGPGVLGTIVPINTIGLVALAVLAYALSSNPFIALIACAFGFAFLVYANERAFRYAEQNPIPALFSGGELLQLFRDQMSAKDRSIVSDNATPIAGSGPKLIDGEDQR